MFQKVVFLIVLLSVSSLAFGQSKRTISVSPTAIDFGGVVLGATGMHSLTLSNTGTMPLKVSSISSSSTDFVVTAPVESAMLAVGESAQLAVTFVPQLIGAKSGSLTVVSNANNSPTVIAVSGNATAPLAPLSISTNSLPSATEGLAYSAVVSGTGGKTPCRRIASTLGAC
ncbi:MAG: choice-of-anchor D domain-containing protein [Terriglobales bacterium]